MKLDGATIPIEQRSLGGIIDLAVGLYRNDFLQVIVLTLIFTVPACMLAYWASVETQAGGLLSLAVFYLLSPILGALLVAGVGTRAFGDPFTLKGALSLFLAHSFRLIFWLWTPRLLILGLGCLLYMTSLGMTPLLLCLPLALLVSKGSMLVREVILLEKLEGYRLRLRLADLRHGDAVGVAQRYLGTLLFASLVVIIAFLMLDSTATFVLEAPVLFGRLQAASLGEAVDLLLSDPRCVVTATAVVWLAYPLARLTLYLCYVDIRIRKECWDLELDFRIEARRLEGIS